LPSQSNTPVVFLPPFPGDCLSSLHRCRCCCLLGLSKDRLSIGPPCRSPFPAPTPSPLAWLVVRSLRGGGCHRALARPAYVPTLPFLRLRRFSPPASYPACAGPRSWGSLRFRPLRLSPLLPSPLRGFHPSKLCSPPNAATFAHAMVAAVHQPHRCRCDSLNPFPSRSCSPRFHESERNLKGFLVLRSRTPPRCCQRRWAFAPLGLPIL